MIPRIIHYCWLSNEPYPEKIQQCIDSWKLHLPDYEFRLWNSASFELSSVPYVWAAYNAKKWAFCADYIRFYAIYHYGGIYLDSDVFLLKNLDGFLANEFFMASEPHIFKHRGNEIVKAYPEAAFFGGVKGAAFAKEVLAFYSRKKFRKFYGYDLTPMPLVLKRLLKKYHYRAIDEDQLLSNGVRIFSSSVFTNVNFPKDNVYGIHNFAHSWSELGRIHRIAQKLIPSMLYSFLRAVRKKITELLYY